MNKTRIIKKIVGTVLAEKGFKYIRCERRLVWTFGRKIGDVEQKVYIQQHDYLEDDYKLMFFSSAEGNGMEEIGGVLPEYKEKAYWRAETDDEFVEVMEFFATFIREHGFDLLEDMLTEKPDSFETPERKQYFKEHRKELVKKYDDIYHILGNGTPIEQLNHIDDVLYENRVAEETPEEIERINELWLGMAAILIEIVLDFQGDAKVAYDTYRVELQFNRSAFDIMPIYLIVQAWGDYHFNNDRSENVVWGRARDTVTYKL